MSGAPVEVEPFVVLMAIRYGLPRATYAHSDAIGLAVKHASVLREWADTLTRDIRATEHGDFMFQCSDGLCRLQHDRAVTALNPQSDDTEETR